MTAVESQFGYYRQESAGENKESREILFVYNCHKPSPRLDYVVTYYLDL